MGRFLYGERAGVEGWSNVNMFEQVKAVVIWALCLGTDRQTYTTENITFATVTTLHCDGSESNDNPYQWRSAASYKFDLVIVNQFNV